MENLKKDFKVSIQSRNFDDSESFHINGEEEFTMNGKVYKFKDVDKINIAHADGNGGWNAEDLDLSRLSTKGKKKL